MEENPDFALHQIQGLNSKILYKTKWREITNILNTTQGPRKTPQQWTSTWSDWKVSVKKKYRNIQNLMRKSGEDTEIIPEMTPLEKRLLILIGKPILEPTDNSATEPTPESSSESTTETTPELEPIRNRKRKKISEQDIFEMQKKQMKLTEEMIKNTKKLNENIMNISDALSFQNELIRTAINLHFKIRI